MHNSLVISLCVLATFVLIEARPWYGGFDGDYGNTSESEGGYADGIRADDGSSNNQGQFSIGGSSGRGFSRYGSSRRGGGGYDSNARGDGGYGSGGRESARGSGHSGRGRPYPSNNDRGYNHAYIPENCPHCTIRSFGDGEYNTNTFNLPREAYY